jgi:hypothetical protein
MTAPTALDLPDDFGNPWMAKLQEIELPEPVAMTPQAPGWFVLAGLAALCAAWLLWRGYRRWARNAYRRQAMMELEKLKTDWGDPGQRSGVPGELSALVKRTALSAYPRAEVASLAGDAWLGFLDGSIGSTEFTRGSGRPLAYLAYAPSAEAALSEDEVSGLLWTVSRWIRRHRGARSA